MIETLNTKYHIENMYHQLSDLQVVCVAEYVIVIQQIKSLIKTFRNQIDLLFYFVLKIKFTIFTCSNLLSFIVKRFMNLCHSLSLVASLAVTRFTTRYHLLSLVVIRCHSFNQSLPLLVTQCTIRLPFFKRSSVSYFLYFSIMFFVFILAKNLFPQP